MSQEIEVGDVIKAHLYGGWIYMEVFEVDLVSAVYRGYFGDSIEEARRVAAQRDASYLGHLGFRDRPQIAVKKQPAAPAASTTKCTCPWSMFVRGCECGAIKPYRLEVGA